MSDTVERKSISDHDKLVASNLQRIFNAKKSELGLTQIKLAAKMEELNIKHARDAGHSEDEIQKMASLRVSQSLISRHFHAGLAITTKKLLDYASILEVPVTDLDPHFENKFPTLNKQNNSSVVSTKLSTPESYANKFTRGVTLEIEVDHEQFRPYITTGCKITASNQPALPTQKTLFIVEPNTKGFETRFLAFIDRKLDNGKWSITLYHNNTKTELVPTQYSLYKVVKMEYR